MKAEKMLPMLLKESDSDDRYSRNDTSCPDVRSFASTSCRPQQTKTGGQDSQYKKYTQDGHSLML